MISAFALAGCLTSAFYLLQQGQKELQFCQFFATFHVGLSSADDNSVSSCRCLPCDWFAGILRLPLCLLLFFLVYSSS